MSNDFYNANGFPLNSQEGHSIDMRAELLALQAAFDKMPALTGNQNRNIVVNSSGNGLTVSSGVNAASTPWTPTLTAATPGDLSVVYSTRTGNVLRVAGLVVVKFEIITSTFTHTTASGNLLITGFPVAPFAGDAYGVLAFSGITKASYTQFTLKVASGATQATILAAGSAQAIATLAITDCPTGGTVHLKGSLTYEVNG